MNGAVPAGILTTDASWGNGVSYSTTFDPLKHPNRLAKSKIGVLPHVIKLSANRVIKEYQKAKKNQQIIKVRLDNNI